EAAALELGQRRRHQVVREPSARIDGEERERDRALALQRDKAAVVRQVWHAEVVELPVFDRHRGLGLVPWHVDLAGGADREQVLDAVAGLTEADEPENVRNYRLGELRTGQPEPGNELRSRGREPTRTK